jgi:hypothetical protein
MVRWEMASERDRTPELAARLADGWEPYAVTQLGQPWIELRRRIPEPLRPCEGCRFAVKTPNLLDADGTTLANGKSGCRRFPGVMPVDGQGCGEWEVANV